MRALPAEIVCSLVEGLFDGGDRTGRAGCPYRDGAVLAAQRYVQYGLVGVAFCEDPRIEELPLVYMRLTYRYFYPIAVASQRSLGIERVPVNEINNRTASIHNIGSG